MAKDILDGNTINDNECEGVKGVPCIVLDDRRDNRNPIEFDNDSIFKNLLLIGGPGSGKSNIMYQIVDDILSWNRNSGDGVALIFDTKKDFIQHKNNRRQLDFYTQNDYVISNDSEYIDESVVWNIFDEVMADGDDPSLYKANAREIANTLFKDRGSTTQPFFANAARDVFAAMIVYFIENDRSKCNNYDFIAFMKSKDTNVFKNCFMRSEDSRGLITYLGDGTNTQALGVLGELRSMIEDCFQGVFYKKPTAVQKSFSIRKAIRDKGGKTIFLLYDLSLGETLTPIYRLIVDLALKESLSNHANGHTHVFLDELKLLPKVSHLEDALNFGRSKRVSVIAGLQSVGQIHSTYGEDTGNVILGGFGSVFALKTNDYVSREYESQLFGPNVIAYTYFNRANEPLNHVREGHVVEHWHIQNLDVGTGFIKLASQKEAFYHEFIDDSERYT